MPRYINRDQLPRTGQESFVSPGGPDGTIYAVYLAEPGEMTMPARVTVNGMAIAKGSNIEMLGHKGSLRWKGEGDTGIVVTIPAALQNHPPCRHAWTFVIHKNPSGK